MTETERDLLVDRQILMMFLDGWRRYAIELEQLLPTLVGDEAIEGLTIDEWISSRRQSWTLPPRQT
jgi:hypothetical protein